MVPVAYVPLMCITVAALAAITSISRRLAVVGTVVSAILSTILSIYVLLRVQSVTCILSKELCVEPFRAYNLALVSLVYLLVAIALPASIRWLTEEGGLHRLYVPAINATFALLLLLVVSNNLFMIWVLLELSTLLTVYLVAVKGGRAAEAAWKYLIVCGIGMAFSLYGLILLYSVGVAYGVKAPWLITSLHAKLQASQLTLLASLFVIAGFSVKAGLFPGYVWLPDAYAEAPHLVSAILGGVLTYMPLYSLMLVLQATPYHTAVALLLTILALLSILAGAAGMLVTHDLKRLYAYSSIEHMGVLALLAACHYGFKGDISKLAFIAFNLHALAHSISKTAVFIGSGGIQSIFRSRRISRIDIGVERWIGWPLFIHTLFLAGIPPSPLFLSELLAFTVVSSNTVLLAAYTIVLFAAFATLSYRAMQLYSRRSEHAIRTSYSLAPVKVSVVTSLVLLLLITVAFLSGVKLNSVWG